MLLAAGPIRGSGQYERLNRRERRALDGARQVIAYDRERGIGIYRAIRELRSKGVRTSIGSVRRYFGNAVTNDWRGRLSATERDPNLRVMRILTTEGMREIYVRGSQTASVIGAYESAVRSARLGDETALERWRSSHGARTFKGADGGVYAAETDPDVIAERDERGELEFEDIYPDVT
jgi:hypothetical protein